MHRITIVRTGGTLGSGFVAELSIDGRDCYEVTITNPFRKKQEAELELHFEKWHRFPFVDATVAERAAYSIKEYGTHLFNEVFANKGSQSAYVKLLDQLSEVLIEIVSQSPDFHALHWEAMWDPSHLRPLAVDCAMVRRSLEHAPLPVTVEASTFLNLLVVVARPEGEWDVGYRTISRPVVETVQAGKLRVNVELLRPGTFEALCKQLEARGAGYYHIVHLDCHGELLDYNQAREVLGYRTVERSGRKPMKRYKGVKPYLMLEGEMAGTVDLVTAFEMGKLLARANVPICILGACQSGKQVLPSTDPPEDHLGNPTPYGRDTSLGSCLLSKGVHVVVAMAYRVTVSAAQVLMEELYTQLCAQRPVLECLQLGRLKMYNNKKRRAYRNVMVELEDWMLPVVYANEPLELQLHEFEQRNEEEEYSARFCSRCHFRVPRHGFVGRDLDILKIEKSLLNHGALLLRGMGGSGKTTLLRYLQEWWQVTHFAAHVFYFGYDERAWTLQQMLMQVVQQIGDEHAQHELQALNDAVLGDEVIERLKGSSCVFILDNLESVTCKELSTLNTLPVDEQAKVCGFLEHLLQGQTKVVLGSRGNTGWLSDVYCDNVHILKGLDPESQSALAEKIVERCIQDGPSIANLKRDDDFHHLLKILGGCPLAMEVVLANLEQQTPKQLLAGLDIANIHLDSCSDDRDGSILHCIEYSFNTLCTESQQLLICLAPFRCALVWPTLQLYIEELQETAPFGSISLAKFSVAIRDATNWGLLSPCNTLASGDDDTHLLNMHPVFPFFLKTKLGELEEDQCNAIRTSFKAAYRVAAEGYSKFMQSKSAKERDIGLRLCTLEYDNIHNALVMCMEDMESADVGACLMEYFDQKNDYHSGVKLGMVIVQAQTAYPSPYRTEEIMVEVARMQVLLGKMHARLRDYGSAKEAYMRSLAIAQSAKSTTKVTKSWLAVIHHNLGAAAEQVRDFVEARQNYERALEIYIELNDRHSQADTYHHMGRMAKDLRDFVEARQNYERALEIYIEFSDRHSQATSYHQVGMVAQELRDFVKARQNYQRALDIYIEFNDRHSQAITYHGMGVVAQELGDFVEARQYYQQALDIYIEFNDQHSQAYTYHQIGSLAQEMRDSVEAHQNYQRALDMFTELNDRHSQATTYLNMGMVAQRLRDFVEAHQNYEQALNIFIEFNDRHSQAQTYHQMGSVAEDLRDFVEARKYYQHALDIKIELNDRHSQAKTYQRMGSVAKEVRDFGEARQSYQRALDMFTESNDQHSQAATYISMGVLAQELRDFVEAHQNYQQALNIYIEFNDQHSQASTYHNMGVVAQELSNFAEARENYRRALNIFIEFNDRHFQARTYNQMGRVAEKLRDFVEANQNYQRALNIFTEFNDQHSQATTYHNMGMVAKELGDFVNAYQNYQRALNIYINLNDRRSQANTYQQMGMVAQELRNFVVARQNYQRALDIDIEFNDQHSQAKTYEQIGMVAEELRDFAEAHQNYQRALDIYIELNDQHSQATTYHNMGMVAEELRDFEEARQNYQRALNICGNLNERHSQANTYHQMGVLAQELGDFVEARQNYQRALEIEIEFDDRHSQACTYYNMGMMAQKLKDFVEAHQNYQQGLSISIELDDCHQQAEFYRALGMLCFEQELLLLAKENIRKAVEFFLKVNDEQHAVSLIQFLERSATGKSWHRHMFMLLQALLLGNSWPLRILKFSWRFF